MIQATPHKRGDTFAYAGHLALTQDGAPLASLAGVTIAAQVRTGASLQAVATLAVTTGDATPDGFPVSLVCMDTRAWPPEQLCFDVQVTFPGGTVCSTETVWFLCMPDVTL